MPTLAIFNHKMPSFTESLLLNGPPPNILKLSLPTLVSQSLLNPLNRRLKQKKKNNTII